MTASSLRMRSLAGLLFALCVSAACPAVRAGGDRRTLGPQRSLLEDGRALYTCSTLTTKTAYVWLY